MDLNDLIEYLEDIRSEVEIETNQDLIPLVTPMVGRTNEVRFWIYSKSIKNNKNSSIVVTKIDPKIKSLVISRIEHIIELFDVIPCSIGYQEFKSSSITYNQTIDDLKLAIDKGWVQFFIILKIPVIDSFKLFSYRY